MNFPTARSENLVVQELSDELLICDTKTYRAFCLNKTAAEVWKLCDGKNDVKEIAKHVSKTLGIIVSEEFVWLALDKLSKDNLLEKTLEADNKFSGLSRREVIRRVGLTSMVALPVIASLVMPTAAMAQSGCVAPSGSGDVALGCPCNIRFDCDSGCCDNNVCAPANTGSCVTNLGAPCTSNAQCTGGLVCCAPANPACSFGC